MNKQDKSQVGLQAVQFILLYLIAKCSFTFFRCHVNFPADDECGAAPFLKQSECSGSNCDGLLKGKWHKIKCFPFSISVRRSLCSKWCHALNPACWLNEALAMWMPWDDMYMNCNQSTIRNELLQDGIVRHATIRYSQV